MHKRLFYGIISIGGFAGMIAAFLQMLEKVTLLKHAGVPLVCDLGGAFSCSSVLNAWQSSVFGFPNALLCIIFFTIFFVAGVAGLSASTLSRTFRVGVQGLALFVLGFAVWFLEQSLYSIGSLCILCVICFGGLLLVNAALLRLNVNDLPGKHVRLIATRAVGSGADLFVWSLLAVLFGFAVLVRFY